MRIIFSLIAITLLLISCEKNDLCDGADVQTPRLHIELKDQFDISQSKPINYLEAYIENSKDTLSFQVTDKLFLPLIPDKNKTTWILNLYDKEGKDKTKIGTDTIVFSYIPQYIYISRACGFKSNFTAFSFQRNPQAQSWIKGINVLTTTISDENETHIQIYY